MVEATQRLQALLYMSKAITGTMGPMFTATIGRLQVRGLLEQLLRQYRGKPKRISESTQSTILMDGF